MTADHPSRRATLISRRMDFYGYSSAALANKITHQSQGRLKPDPSLVWRWAKGKTRPGNTYLTALSSALEVDARLLRADIASWAVAGSEEALRFEPINSEPSPEGPFDPEDDVNRRPFLRLGAAVIASTALGDATGAIQQFAIAVAEARDSSPNSRGRLDVIGAVTEHTARSFDKIDYKSISIDLGYHLRCIAALLRQSLKYAERGEACLRGAQMSGMVGLASHLIGELPAAWLHYRNAMELADEIGHLHQLGWLMSEQSSMACYSGNYQRAVELTEYFIPRAQGLNRLNLASNAARSYARMGDFQRTRRYIELVEDGVDDIRSADDCDTPGTPIWNFSQSSALTRVAASYLWLGLGQQAVEAASRAVEITQEKGIPRHGTHAKLTMASAYALMGDPEHACNVAVDTIRSGPKDVFTALRRSSDVIHFLEPYSTRKEVVELKSELNYYKQEAAKIVGSSELQTNHEEQ